MGQISKRHGALLASTAAVIAILAVAASTTGATNAPVNPLGPQPSWGGPREVSVGSASAAVGALVPIYSTVDLSFSNTSGIFDVRRAYSPTYWARNLSGDPVDWEGPALFGRVYHYANGRLRSTVKWQSTLFSYIDDPTYREQKCVWNPVLLECQPPEHDPSLENPFWSLYLEGERLLVPKCVADVNAQTVLQSSCFAREAVGPEGRYQVQWKNDDGSPPRFIVHSDSRRYVYELRSPDDSRWLLSRIEEPRNDATRVLADFYYTVRQGCDPAKEDYGTNGSILPYMVSIPGRGAIDILYQNVDVPVVGSETTIRNCVLAEMQSPEGTVSFEYTFSDSSPGLALIHRQQGSYGVYEKIWYPGPSVSGPLPFEVYRDDNKDRVLARDGTLVARHSLNLSAFDIAARDAVTRIESAGLSRSISALNLDGGAATCSPGMLGRSELLEECGSGHTECMARLFPVIGVGAFAACANEGIVCNNDFPLTAACPDEQLQIAASAEPAGDFDGRVIGYRREYEAVSPTSRSYGKYVAKCVNPMDCEPLEFEWLLSLTDTTGERFWKQQAERTSGNGWTRYFYEAYPTASGQSKALVSSVSAGAVAPDGSQSLRQTSYSYQNNESEAKEVQLASEQRNSVAGSEKVARTLYLWAPNSNRVSATIVEGWTRDINGDDVFRRIGTFYNTEYSCLPDGAEKGNPLKRVVEVVGPCLLDQKAYVCASAHRVVRYVYDDVGNVKDELVYEGTPYPTPPKDGASCGKAAITSYGQIDWKGRPGTVTDPNEGVSTFAYDGPHLVSESRPDGIRTEYTYDQRVGQLQRKTVLEPLADGGTQEVSSEHFCYRIQPDDEMCRSGGTPTHLLQWKGTGKRDALVLSDLVERVEYSYVGDTLVSETVLGASGPTRVTRYAVDGHGRTVGTRHGVNDVVTARVGYQDGVQTAVGLAYNRPPSRCGTPGYVAEECFLLTRDRLARPVSITVTEEDGSTALTCIDYDAHGNVAAVATGCSPDCGSCSEDSKMRYQHDDFGNRTAMFVWRDGVEQATKWEFDHQGNEVKLQTPTMAASGNFLESEYDGLGRLLAKRWSGGGDELYTFVYDDTLPGGGGCPSSTEANSVGRIQRMRDSLGDHWYKYDKAGRVVAILRDRTTDTPNCGEPANEDSPNRLFTYDGAGRLGEETYPHGRKVYYRYDENPGKRGILRAIDVDLFANTSTGISRRRVPIIGDIKWDAGGNLGSYRTYSPVLHADGNITSYSYPQTLISYLRGDKTSQLPALSCGNPHPGSADLTGRLRALWVTRLTSQYSVISGDVLRKTYTWDADQLYAEDSCLLSKTATPARLVFAQRDLWHERKEAGIEDDGWIVGARGYDRSGQLRHVSRPSGHFAAYGGVLGRRDYSYDARGNRIQETADCSCFSYVYDGDLLKRRARSSSTNAGSGCACQPGSSAASFDYTFAYDADGRTTSKTWPGPSSTQPNFALTFDNSVDGAHAAIGAVFRSVTRGGEPSHEYYYDAFGRRRLKLYPDFGTDEFFYDGAKLLEERGRDYQEFDDDDWRYAPLDEYIWLGDRPVAYIKSRLPIQPGQPWTREPDLVGLCGRRDGDGGADCGVYYPITDYLPKAVALLNWQQKVVGAYDYDPFGHVNRVSHVAETPHPYPANAQTILAQFKQPPGPGTGVQLRARFALRDVACGNDSAYMTKIDGTSVLASGICGQRNDERTSDWVQVPADGVVQLRFGSDGVNEGRAGFILEGYEYRRSECSGSVCLAPVQFPLRFPGQYLDAESDLFENWNRFYDPTVGRYLSPDPAAEKASIVASSARSGARLVPYVYADNAPIQKTDSAGLLVDGSAIATAITQCVGGQGGGGARCDSRQLQPALESATHASKTAVTHAAIQGALTLGVGVIGAAINMARGGAVAPGLVHLTSAEAGAAINASGQLVGKTGIYAGPMANAGLSPLGAKIATGLGEAGTAAAVRIPAAAEGAFRAVTPIGPMSGWQALAGTQYTAAGAINLATGAFVQTGPAWNQLAIYGADALMTIAVHSAGYYVLEHP